jgi:sugar O-acyltransferase (sialic acid O-acetyltransferase NeuD family)
VRAVLIGAGGHARAVVQAARGGDIHLVACTDPRPERHGGDVDGVPIVGADDRLPALREEGIEGAVMGLGAIGDNTLRARLFDRIAELGFAMPPVVAADASVAASATLGDGCVVLTRAVVGPGSVLGRNVIINTGAIVEHDCTVLDHAHVATGAVLGGDVEVGELAHVGLGATVRQGIRLGERALAGAGAVVVADVPVGTTVVGVPARARGL